MFSTGNFDSYLKNSDSIDILIQLKIDYLVRDFTKFFDWVFDNSLRQQESIFHKKLGFEKEIGILNPSLLEVIPRLFLSLEKIIESWKGLEISFFEENDVLFIKTQKKNRFCGI
jgi:hypothetical protein